MVEMVTIMSRKIDMKTIAVSENVHEKLMGLCRPGETIPDLLARLLGVHEPDSKKDISCIFGILGDDSDEWDEIERKIYAEREISII